MSHFAPPLPELDYDDGVERTCNSLQGLNTITHHPALVEQCFNHSMQDRMPDPILSSTDTTPVSLTFSSGATSLHAVLANDYLTQALLIDI